MIRRSDGWFVVWTESRAEKKVESLLREKGIDAWLPSVVERHRWSDRWRDVVTPLFPGYLFARGDLTRVPALLTTPGVLTLVKQAGHPVQVADEFIASLRAAVEAGGHFAERVTTRQRAYRAGDEVVVQEGPLAGARGVVKENRGGRKLLIWIREIGRGVTFTIGAARVNPRVASERVPDA